MKNQVDGKIKEERSNKIINLDKDLEKEFMNKFIEKEMPVLYEQETKEKGILKDILQIT